MVCCLSGHYGKEPTNFAKAGKVASGGHATRRVLSISCFVIYDQCTFDALGVSIYSEG